jgi:DNA-binding transcriptional LysR family regulator
MQPGSAIGTRRTGQPLRETPMPLGLVELKSISVAARLGSLSRAAAALNITQPALSRRIAEAEKSLGVQLFDRIPRGVRATEACLAFLQHAEIALANINEGRRAAADVERQQAQVLQIGMMEALCDDVLIAACEATQFSFPGVGITFASALTSAQVSADVLAGDVRLGLRYRQDPSTNLDSAWLADDDVIVACAPSHPLASAGTASLDELEQAQWIGFPLPIDRTVTPDVDEGLAIAGYHNWRTMSVSTIYARLELLKAGFGVGLVRKALVASQLATGSIVELRTPLNLRVPIYLTWRRGSDLGEAAERLRDELVSAYSAAKPSA